LGSPLNGLETGNENLRSRLQEATYDAFERLVDIGIDADIDFMIVAGDLYDRESRSVRANQFAAEQFDRLAEAGVQVYVKYGNHDPVESGTEYIDLPENVHEFPAEEAESVVYEVNGEPAACLCGQSYRRKVESRKFHTDYDPVAPELPTIGLLHTGLNPNGSRYVPCDTAALADRSDIDYWALGHIHQPQIHNRDPVVAYPGIPQGRHINESGARGAYLVDLDADGTADLTFVPTNQITWGKQRVSIEGDGQNGEAPNTIPEIRARIEDQLRASEPTPEPDGLDVQLYEGEWEPSGVMCRLVLTGRGQAHEKLTGDDEAINVLRDELRETYADRSPFVWVDEIRERTRPPLPPLEEIRDGDPVFDQFEDTVAQLQSDEEIREKLVDDVMGSVCQWDGETEDEQPARLEITDADLDRMIDRAADLVLDELRARRVE
jgi:DNA repair exonuclease SbcCD nuclease subunit